MSKNITYWLEIRKSHRYWHEGDEHGEHDCVKISCSVYQTNICSITTMVLYIS